MGVTTKLYHVSLPPHRDPDLLVKTSALKKEPGEQG
jgi:hypothetical protein